MQSLFPFPHFSQLPVLPKISQSRFANSVSGAACSFCPSRSCVTCPNISAKSGLLRTAHPGEKTVCVEKQGESQLQDLRSKLSTLLQPHEASSALKDETRSRFVDESSVVVGGLPQTALLCHSARASISWLPVLLSKAYSFKELNNPGKKLTQNEMLNRWIKGSRINSCFSLGSSVQDCCIHRMRVNIPINNIALTCLLSAYISHITTSSKLPAPGSSCGPCKKWLHSVNSASGWFWKASCS